MDRKDAQQNVIIKKMISDLNMETRLVVCKTMREDNGLAMSSRNTFLSESEKNKASVLKYILDEGKRLILEENIADPDLIIKKVNGIIKERTPEFELQYYAITDNEVLDPIKDLTKYKGEVLISLAAKVGTTRLIDNIIFEKS
ncbi:MAG: pantoate--beta-alanine ligase [Ignavibacteria bacterium]